MAEGRLNGKTALVTGAGSGIGKATSLVFAREGAKVMAADINEDAAKAVAAQIEDSGGEARSLRTDTTSEEDVKAAVQSVVDAWGRLDITVNNAGVGGPQYTWEQLIAVNQNGVYYGCLHSFAQMQKQGGPGAIVNLASIMGMVGATPLDDGEGQGGVGYAYHASKHAVIGLTKQFGLDGAPHGIRCNAICPGWIDTPLVTPIKSVDRLMEWVIKGTPMGRLGDPEEIAKAALFLASEDASFVTGTWLVVDGGWVAR